MLLTNMCCDGGMLHIFFNAFRYIATRSLQPSSWRVYKTVMWCTYLPTVHTAYSPPRHTAVLLVLCSR